MKKFLALLLIFLLVFSLAACGKNKENVPADSETTDPTQPVATQTDDPAADDPEAGDPEAGDPEAEGGEAEGAGESLETVDLSTFTFGVAEDGDNVLVTVKNDTDFGEAACVMTYVYKEGKLEAATADYYVPDTDSAKALAEQLKSDASIVPTSIKVDGTRVSCRIVDAQIEELRQISREELIQVMEYTIYNTQNPQ